MSIRSASQGQSNIEIKDSLSSSSFLCDFIIESITIENDDGSDTGEATVWYTGKYAGYTMKVHIKNGKMEGLASILRENSTLYIRLTYVNNIPEGEVIKKSEFGKTILRGTLHEGMEIGLFTEYDENEKMIWRGFYQNGKRYSSITEYHNRKGFFQEESVTKQLLRIANYDDEWRVHGTCYEYQDGKIREECLYKHGEKKRTLRLFSNNEMEIFDMNGTVIYKGIFFGDIQNGFTAHPPMKGMNGYYKEINKDGELVSVSQYDNTFLKKHGTCFEYDGKEVVRECIFKNNELKQVVREFKRKTMTEYDKKGVRVYEGEYSGDMKNGYYKNGKGTEYQSDGKSALYVGFFENGVRNGYGTEYKNSCALYIGEWKDGKRNGVGKEYNEREEVVKDGKWIEGRWEKDVELDKMKEKYHQMELDYKKRGQSRKGLIFLAFSAVFSL